ncbi:pentatricopeptide repeat-containing protein At5g66520-like [Trifolium pratense]|uniref:pentatricopeptide repeat-containing protein At5g66520-like n=1 Tax=Trifolium pratense TaxID=57577 RepID=UPI001E694F43|nr:pentatricopeptide repeat-containing protein At5g66520-like [Trifolium pratense]XP_045799330.1 pentatricopeptide repeat-containing protein At5g66520-like [Trifolium pratense]XP_045799331.1 pentatricopeptide repeat-containing protein At5g66520-like [Trifolium pratense]XP_045799332.1 pentatricopeptide repeat-containing protein At5g66520-like [Trifolium pratense]XP_045799333.1 pentatricopeptide repeat-containing protein At5g66520-like [Trifolium pratense]
MSSTRNSPCLHLLQQWQNLSMKQTKQIHAHTITNGLTRFSYISSRILAFFALSPQGDFRYAETLFTHMPNPNLFDYNSIITSYTTNSQFHKSLSIFTKMLNTNIRPNSNTFTALVKACDSLSSLEQVFTQSMKLGNSSDVYFVSSVINAFSKHGAIHFARNVFDESSNRNVVCWTSLVSGYCSCGLVNEARELFDEMPQRNDASYSAMVSGYVKNGFYDEGIQLFCELKMNMGCAGVKPSGSLLVSVLNACTTVGAFEEGKWIHSYIEENGLEYELELGTALIDFYAKCGLVKDAKQVFDKMFVKDVATWSAMILGLAINGNNLMALELFEKMEKVGPKPNEVTFIGVLTACNHKNLLDEALRLFGIMTEKYGITPSVEHYGCVVDVLARSGQVEKALTFINSMPMEPDGAIWGSLLNGCLMHGYFELGQKVGKFLIEFEPQHSGRYILLANMYANMCKWEGVSEVRKLMKDRRVLFVSAWSFVEIDQTIHKFFADDKCLYSGEIYEVLNHLGKIVEEFLGDKNAFSLFEILS